MNKLLTGLKSLYKSALKNALTNPKTTTAGVAAVLTGIELAKLGGTENIAAGLVSVLGGLALVLANDPTKDDNDQKPTDNVDSPGN